MSKTISEKIDPNRMPKQPFGLKADTTLHRTTFTPSSANPGDTLYINIPKLPGDNVIVPNSVRLAFDVVIGGHVNNTLVNNIGRNLVSNLKVVLGGETGSKIQSDTTCSQPITTCFYQRMKGRGD